MWGKGINTKGLRTADQNPLGAWRKTKETWPGKKSYSGGGGGKPKKIWGANVLHPAAGDEFGHGRAAGPRGKVLNERELTTAWRRNGIRKPPHWAPKGDGR